MLAALALALAALAAWLVLLFARGGFWRADQNLPGDDSAPAEWPAVAVVIPARDEAETIGQAVRSLLDQEYPGACHVFLVDDGSSDGTAHAALEAADSDPRLTVVTGRELPQGWTGKLWAVSQGLDYAATDLPTAAYVLLTDADVVHDRAKLRQLVTAAEAGGLDMVSLMVRLNAESAWEKLLIPAFVFFFQMLYPFPWVNDPGRATAGAAGGCMLVRRAALERAGGIAAIRDRIIDDCALAALIKRNGPIWLGLTDTTRSLRAYPGLGGLAGLWRMVARTAFVQLGHSPLALAGTLFGMALIFLWPPLAALWGALDLDLPLALSGAAGWALMTVAYQPTLARYGLSPWLGLLLPVAALLYALMTFDSARRHWSGQGAAWKGRTYPPRD